MALPGAIAMGLLLVVLPMILGLLLTLRVLLSEKGHHAGTRPSVPIPPKAEVASISRVLAPSRAAAAVHPAGPPPKTITS